LGRPVCGATDRLSIVSVLRDCAIGVPDKHWLTSSQCHLIPAYPKKTAFSPRRCSHYDERVMTYTSPQTVCPPRLGVGHLLIWVGCCAVYLTLLRQGGGVADWRHFVVICLHATGHGAALAAVVVLALRALRGQRWTIEPGLWLLAAMGVVAAVRIALGLAERDVFFRDEVVLRSIACCLLVLPALSRATPPWWKVVCCLLAALWAAPLAAGLLQHALGGAVVEFAQWASHGRLACAALLLIVAVAIDVRRRAARSWLHFVGAAGFLWIAALPSA